jgi:thiosulfate/3-mercaptopyruvate sulfurtransferase
MTSSPLVTAVWLEQRLGNRNLRILEIGSQPDDASYRAGHVPGATWLYWKSACWHETDRELVTPEAMARLFSGLGIAPETTVVLYGDPVQFGCYAYWAFTMAGHRRLRLLDGARRKWVADGHPLARDMPVFSPTTYPIPVGTQSIRVGRRNVRENLKAPHRLLLDVRSPEEYAGKRVIEYALGFDHGAERFGRIPGAVHLYYRQFLNEDDTFKSPDALRRVFADASIAPEAFTEIVCYCRLSHRATLVWFAMTHLLGYRNVKVYDGSWTEWGSIVGYPIEK